MAEKADFIYADYRLVASTNPAWIRSEFDGIIGLFERIGLQNKVGKMVLMLCQPGTISGRKFIAAYE